MATGNTGFGAFNAAGDATPSGVVQQSAMLAHAGLEQSALSTYGAPSVQGQGQGGGYGGGGGGGGGGFSLGMDPGYMQALAEMQNQQSQMQAAEQAAEERAIVDFGDPSMAKLAGFNLDPQTAALTQQNYASGNATMARLDHANQLAKQAVINRLAGHGMVDSGDLGYLEGEQGRAFGNQSYDARQKLLDYFTQLHQSYQDRRNSMQQSLMAAMQNAYMNAMNGAYGYGGGGGGGGGVGLPGGSSNPTNYASQIASHTPSGETYNQMANNGQSFTYTGALGSGWGNPYGVQPGTQVVAVKMAPTGGGGGDTILVPVG